MRNPFSLGPKHDSLFSPLQFGILFSVLLGSMVCRAQSNLPLPTEAVAIQPPAIEAKIFEITVQKRSRSAGTYRFSVSQDQMIPEAGRLLLLKRDGVSVMAFRALKTYPESSEFAARRVRRYGDLFVLDPGETFTAIMKLSEISITDKALSPTDQVELKELEGAASAPPSAEAPAAEPSASPTPAEVASETVTTPVVDPELAALDTSATPLDSVAEPDAALDQAQTDEQKSSGSEKAPQEESSKEKKKSIDSLDEEIDELEGFSEQSITTEDNKPFDPYRHRITAQAGMFRLATESASSEYRIAAGFRYAFTPWLAPWIRQKTLQDAFSIETGFFFSKAIDFLNEADQNNSLDVLTWIPTLQYSVMGQRTFGFFVYAGIQVNRVIRATFATQEAVSALNRIYPAVGAGLLLNLGPNWDARVDFGFDTVSGGVSLKF